MPELAIQYADFAAWQRRWLSGAVLDQQLAYWKERLTGAPALDLPTVGARPRTQTFRGAHHPVRQPAELVTALTQLSRERGATLFMTLMAAFQVLLSRTSRQSDISVGTPVANRTRSEVEPLIGFFVNTLVLRSDLAGDPRFTVLLERVKESALSAYAHQDVPFERVVDAVVVNRDPSRSPLFQAMLALQNGPMPIPALADLEMAPLEVESGIAKVDLTLTLTDEARALSGALEYNADLFEAAAVAAMAARFELLLQGIAAHPEQRIGELPFLLEAERHQVLAAWNDTASAPPREACVHELLEAQVERTPEAVAVVFEGRTLTYGALDAQANQLAHHLRGLGVGRGVLVGLCVERSLAMVVGLLGILKAGGAYVPLDPEYPRERLGFMLDDARAPVLLTQASLVERLPEHGARVVRLDADWPEIAGAAASSPTSGSRAEDLAYVIYTSGSTGRPKGVEIPHGAVVNLLEAMSAAVPMDAADAWLAVTSISFDIAGLELFLPLARGARLLLASREATMSADALIDLLRTGSATVMQATPATWR
ncbi:MAG: AMP-binding protein, partial [Byssovorax sp.]